MAETVLAGMRHVVAQGALPPQQDGRVQGHRGNPVARGVELGEELDAGELAVDMAVEKSPEVGAFQSCT